MNAVIIADVKILANQSQQWFNVIPEKNEDELLAEDLVTAITIRKDMSKILYPSLNGKCYSLLKGQPFFLRKVNNTTYRLTLEEEKVVTITTFSAKVAQAMVHDKVAQFA